MSLFELPYDIFLSYLTLKGRGYFTNEKDGGDGPLWSPPRLSLLVVMGRGRFFQGTNILKTEKYFVIESKRLGHTLPELG